MCLCDWVLYLVYDEEKLFQLISYLGQKKVGYLWKQSSLRWEDFMPAANVEQFVKDRVCESTDFMRYLLKIITINVLNLN